MVDKLKKRKRGSIGEEDVSILLQRYSPKTVLDLLQEVANAAGEKIDWNAMVKNTATGISNPREFQMLWRLLAYGQTLIDQSDNDLDPMDEDSDLEYELSAFPFISREASAEAAACVKVLMASGCPNESHVPNNSTIEAPMTINIPNTKANAIHGTNVSIPVSVQKQPLSSGEKRENSNPSGANFPPRRKRRAWTAEEDEKLMSAVQKYGERNWANIARGEFDNDRRASELSHRWGSLRKKQGNSNAGTSSQLSESQLAAAHRAMSLALDMPMGGILAQKASMSRPNQHKVSSGPPKPQIPPKNPPTNPTPGPDSLIKAAAVAAGARIATPTDASLLLEATRSPIAVHITTGANLVAKTSTMITNQLPSNVHFIRNGLAKTPISAYPNVSSMAANATSADSLGIRQGAKVEKEQISASVNAVKEESRGEEAPASCSGPIGQIRDGRVDDNDPFTCSLIKKEK